jgi:protein TonB
MNSSVTYLDFEPAEIGQSTADPSAMFAAVGARAARRVRRSWQQQTAIALGVIVLQIALATALIRGGYVTVPKLPEALSVVIIPQQDLVIKAPPPTMPEIPTPIVPVQTITIDVQSETAITLPPPRQETAKPAPAASGGGVSPVLAYQNAVLRQIDAAKRYPALARAQHRQGVALVQFSMDRNGRVLSASLAKTSNAKMLDSEAVEAVERASPFPAPPAELAGDPVNLMVAVEFSLH